MDEAIEAGMRAGESADLIADAAKQGEGALQDVLKDLKIPTDNIITNADGSISFKNGSTEVPLKDLKEEYYKNAKTGAPPDFGELLGKMGFKAEDINTESVKDLIKNQTDSFNAKYEDVRNAYELGKKGAEIESKGNKPPTSEEESSKIPKKMENEVKTSYTDSIKSAGKAAGKLGKWVAETVKTLAPYGLVGYFAYDMIKSHQQACNGCWKIEYANPNNRCKITNLTCSQNARNASSITCAPCNAQSANLCKGNEYNPCLLSNNKYYKPCSKEEKDNDTGHTSCDKNTGDHLGPGINGNQCLSPIKTPEDDKDGCKTTDDDTWCSKNCDCANSAICEDGKYFLQCTSFNFWAAAGDLTNQTAEGLEKMFEGPLSTIFTILKYVAIGIVILVSVLVVFEIIRFFLYGSHTNNESKNVNPPPPPPPQAYPNIKNTGNPFDEFQ
jgi:hypothetical protein